MAKTDATRGAFTAADYDDQWTYYATLIAGLRSASARPSVAREAAGYRFEYWIDASETTEPCYVAVFAPDGPLVGLLSFGKRGDVLLANEVAVRKAYRRRGIASAMYNLGEHVTHLKFVPSRRHSPYASAFWAGRSGRAR
jgi:GNAT superfamily N-acetyltransferase